jgi:hypothetical protein
LNAFWNIVPPPDGIERGCVARLASLDRDTTIRDGGRRRKAARYGQREHANKMTRAILAPRQAKRTREIEEINAATRG